MFVYNWFAITWKRRLKAFRKKPLIFTPRSDKYINWTRLKFKLYYTSRFMYVLPKIANSNVCNRLKRRPSLTSENTLHLQCASLILKNWNVSIVFLCLLLRTSIVELFDSLKTVITPAQWMYFSKQFLKYVFCTKNVSKNKTLQPTSFDSGSRCWWHGNLLCGMGLYLQEISSFEIFFRTTDKSQDKFLSNICEKSTQKYVQYLKQLNSWMLNCITIFILNPRYTMISALFFKFVIFYIIIIIIILVIVVRKHRVPLEHHNVRVYCKIILTYA